MAKSKDHRLDRSFSLSLRNWQRPEGPDRERMTDNAWVNMGWGRIIFGHTFVSDEELYATICAEELGMRDLIFYIRDPHVLLSMGPQKIFLDPSHTYRLWLNHYQFVNPGKSPFIIRRLTNHEDASMVNQIYAMRGMVGCDPAFLADRNATKLRTYLVAENVEDRRIIGTVSGIDHVEAFNDPENGASLWCLAVDPQADAPGVGEAMVRHLAEHYFTRGRDYVDLSVMHDNQAAIALYEKLGFQRVPVFCLKRKNPINEPLFMAPEPEHNLNPYASIIVDEARRRGIEVHVLDAENSYFKLELGGRSIVCRESLSELTSAIAMSRCDDKRVTNRIFKSVGLNVPLQFEAKGPEANARVLKQLSRVVVKPAKGEQGRGVSVDVRSAAELENAVRIAGNSSEAVIIEELAHGQDLRIIVIDFKVVAAAVRRPPVVTGTGRHSVKALIEKYNRRRAAATGGESHIPLDRETERCIRSNQCDLDTILPSGEELCVRKTANLHTGGTIHDVTPELHPSLARAAERAALALDVPVTGLDFFVPDVTGPDYKIIEANERPGLANHEPQPTAERFIDFLFPRTAVA